MYFQVLIIITFVYCNDVHLYRDNFNEDDEQVFFKSFSCLFALVTMNLNYVYDYYVQESTYSKGEHEKK